MYTKLRFTREIMVLWFLIRGQTISNTVTFIPQWHLVCRTSRKCQHRCSNTDYLCQISRQDGQILMIKNVTDAHFCLSFVPFFLTSNKKRRIPSTFSALSRNLKLGNNAEIIKLANLMCVWWTPRLAHTTVHHPWAMTCRIMSTATKQAATNAGSTWMQNSMHNSKYNGIYSCSTQVTGPRLHK